MVITEGPFVSNPWPYLAAEERYRDSQALEALFLTFAADTGFFESRVLGVSKASGARVTVLADASVWQANPRALAQAGRAYHMGLIDVRGAFHPKLVVLAGGQRATVAVGSGNLTLGGWQYNSELWSIMTSSGSQCPSSFDDLAMFLMGLAKLTSDRLSHDALQRSAAVLKRLHDSAHRVVKGPRVVSSLEKPIIDQLPNGPVDEMLVSAPFFDPRLRALEALMSRLRPGRVAISIQPHATVIESEALLRLTKQSPVPVEIFHDAETPATGDRYRHGKLVEWAVGGEHFALTGSPNISRSALTLTAKSGNVEIGLVTKVGDSLFPRGVRVAAQDIPTYRIPRVRDQLTLLAQPSISLLGAVIEPDGLHLSFSAETTKEMQVEASPPAAGRDEWDQVGVISPGVRVLVLPIDVAAGTRIRIVEMGVEGVLLHGPALPASDPNLVLQRTATHQSSGTGRARARDLLGSDLGVLEHLRKDLEQLARDVTLLAPLRVAGGAAGSSEGNGTGSPSDSEKNPWFWERELAAVHHGAHIAAFGLGLPSIPPGSAGVFEELEILTDDRTAGLSEETAEFVDDDAETEDETKVELNDLPPDHRDDHERIRLARQRWCSRMTQRMVRLPIVSRMTVLRLLLTFWAAGNWLDGDLTPLRLTVDAVGALEKGPRSPELSARVGSLVAVAITMAHDRVDLATTNEGMLLYRRLYEESAYLSLDRSEEALKEFCRQLTTVERFPLRAEHVAEVVARHLDDDPLSEPISVLEADGLVVERHSANVLLVRGSFRSPELTALRALGRLEEQEPVAVWAVNDTGAWALLAWRRPDLIRVTPIGPRCRWRHQVLTNLLSPATVYEQRLQSGGLRGERRHGPQNQPFAEAIEILDALGLPNPPLPPISATHVSGRE